MSSKPSDTIKQIEDLRKLQQNKKCFDCGHSGTTYAVVDIGVFVCSICAGIHREFSHRVKGISMSNFSVAEVDKLKSLGNEKAAQTWLARHNIRNNPIPDIRDLSRMKDFLRQIYLDKRFYEEAREQAAVEEVKVAQPIQRQMPEPVQRQISEPIQV